MLNIADVTVEPDSGVRSAAYTSTFAPEFLAGYRFLLWEVEMTLITTPDADDKVHIILQVRLPSGAFADIGRMTFTQADNGTTPRLCSFWGADARAHVHKLGLGDLTLDNQSRDLPTFRALRVRAEVAGATAPSYRFKSWVRLW